MHQNRRAAAALAKLFCMPVLAADLNVRIDARDIARRRLRAEGTPDTLTNVLEARAH